MNKLTKLISFFVVGLFASAAEVCYGFGNAVSIFGNTAMVDNYDSSGSVSVFSRDDDGWKLGATISSPPGAMQFGSSISISGDTAVIGADTGASGYVFCNAYIFSRDGGDWKYAATLNNPDCNTNYFGESVSISGDTVIVGAPATQSTQSVAAAYIFRKDGTLVKELNPTPQNYGSKFGSSVSISGDTAVVGSPYDGMSEKSIYEGAIYIYDRNSGGQNNWGLVAKLTVPDSNLPARFGGSVSISGDTAIAGDNSMNAFIFRKDETTGNWKEEQGLQDKYYTEFGNSVSISGDTAMVGAPAGNSAYIFSYDQGAASWKQIATLSTTTRGNYGWDISISGDMAIVGNPDYNPAEVYIYQNINGSWTQVANFTSSTTDT